MENKRGDITTEEVVKLIISVMGILLLIFLLVELYSLSKKNEIEQAKNLMSEIENTLQWMEKNNQPKDTSIILTNPNKWSITLGETSNTLCICPGINIDEETIKSCKKSKGVCKTFQNPLSVPHQIYIETKEIIHNLIIQKQGQTITLEVERTSKEIASEHYANDDPTSFPEYEGIEIQEIR